MIYKEERISGARLVTYVLSNYPAIDMERRRAMIVICPGGGYRKCSDREAEAVAIRFNSLGYNCAVLYYTVNVEEKGKLYPIPQRELAEAISWIRANAEGLNTDPTKVVVLGFSAGGHLAASLGTFWREYGPSSRPDALVLCYPVISSGPLAHERSIRNLIGEDDSLLEKVSLEKQVGPDTPPSFIWTTRTDQSVPFGNSVVFKEALDRFGIENELVIYPEGVHGLSLGTREVMDPTRRVTQCVQDWPERADAFLRKVLGSVY